MLQTTLEFLFTYFNNTPLHFATRGSNLLIVQALIASGAKIGVQNNSKETPLSSAKISRHSSIKEYLIGISTKKIQRLSLNELIKQHLPILNDEEEEEEESRDDMDQIHNSLTDSNSIDNINIKPDLKSDGKGSKQLSKLYKDIKQIEKRINSVKDSIQIVELNSKKYPDNLIISPPNEEDSHLNNLSKYINDLSGKINYIEHTLGINQKKTKEEVEEEEKNENENETNANKSKNEKVEDKNKNEKTNANDADENKNSNKDQFYDKEPLQEEIKSFYPFFKSKKTCYYCGSCKSHACSKCKHFVCPICTYSILHTRDDE